MLKGRFNMKDKGPGQKRNQVGLAWLQPGVTLVLGLGRIAYCQLPIAYCLLPIAY